MFFQKNIKKIYKNKIRNIKKKYEKRLQKERNRFICVLNHDVKTPILAQIRSLELLLEGSFGSLNNEQKEIIQETLNSHYHLYGIVSNTLFLANFESEKPKLNLEPVDIIEEIEDCVHLIKNFATDKQQNFVVKSNKNKRIKINADRKLVQKIIFNLLANSVSSGFENSIIEILVKQNKNSVSFSTKNKSIYMTKEKLNSLFEEKKTLRDFSQLGMSLNLNIVKKLIEAHNWNIVAKSEKNNSSTFGFIAQTKI